MATKVIAALAAQPTLAPLAPAASPPASSDPATPPANTTLSLTQKEWILPPRPKPGRKPATDVPPTKRKAQNRAAQRAFRERRAAKVGELEEQMDEIMADHEKEVDNFKTEIVMLNEQVAQLNELLNSYEIRMKAMGDEISRNRIAEKTMEREISILRGEAVELPRRTKAEVVEKKVEHAYQTPEQDVPLGCGRCSLDTHCQCIEEAIDMHNLMAESESAKRSHSPDLSHQAKRPRTSNDDAPAHLAYEEIDFTTKIQPLSTIEAAGEERESCGFCTDKSTCLCAEIAANVSTVATDARQPAVYESVGSTSMNGMDLPNFAFKRGNTASNSCQDGPGTCTQCRGSPQSTLFCKSLAAARARPIPPPGLATETDEMSCGKDACCHSKDAPTIANRANTLPPIVAGPTLSCAEAFTTLSRHPAFDRASDELGAWLPQLATVPVPSTTTASRTAFEIEASSVLGVLRFFDRRFGSGHWTFVLVLPYVVEMRLHVYLQKRRCKARLMFTYARVEV